MGTSEGHQTGAALQVFIQDFSDDGETPRRGTYRADGGVGAGWIRVSEKPKHLGKLQGVLPPKNSPAHMKDECGAEIKPKRQYILACARIGF